MMIVNFTSGADIDKVLKNLWQKSVINVEKDPFWRLGHLDSGYTIELWKNSIKGAYVDDDAGTNAMAVLLRVYFRLRHKETENGIKVKGVIYPSFFGVFMLIFMLALCYALWKSLLILFPMTGVIVITRSFIRMEMKVHKELKEIMQDTVPDEEE